MTTTRRHPNTAESTPAAKPLEHEDRVAHAYRAALGGTRRPAALDDRVLEEMRSESARERTACKAPRRDSATLTRRRFVALGAGTAVAAGLGALGVVLPLIRERGSNNAGGGNPVSPDGSASPGAPLFGLAVANAAEVEAGTKTFDLAPTSRGIMAAVTSRGSVSLALNYEVIGEGLEHVGYALENVPTITKRYAVGEYVEQPVAEFEECLLSWTSWNINGGFSEMRSFLPARRVRDRSDELDMPPAAPGSVSHQHDENRSMEFALDGAEATDMDASSDDATYQVLSIQQRDDFWASDPVLVAYRAYEDQRAKDLERTGEERTIDGVTYRIEPQPSEELAQAQFAFWQAFSEVYSDRDAFIAWMKPLYVTALELAAQTLDNITLAIRGTFADGSEATRRYRLGLVDGYEQVAQNRFDALLEACGLTMGEDGTYYANGNRYSINDDQLPFFDFVAGLPPDDADDPRLQAPLFTITDITDEQAQTQG